MFASGEAANAGSFVAVDWALFLSVSLVWGASFLLMAESLEAFTPAVVTLGRVGLGALALGAIRLATRVGRNDRHHSPTRIERSDYGRVFLVALLWVAVPFTLFPLAQQWVNSSVAGLLNGATPIFVSVVSAVLVRVPPNPVQRIGLAVGFLGILAISIGSASGGSSEAKGVLLVLGATICYGFAINIASPLQSRYGAVLLMSTVLGLATLMVAPLALVDLGSNVWNTKAGLSLAFLGVVGTGLAYWTMATLVGRVGSIRASFITYLIPVVSLVLGVTIRGDSLSVLAALGAPATIAGAVLAGRGRARLSR